MKILQRTRWCTFGKVKDIMYVGDEWIRKQPGTEADQGRLGGQKRPK